MTSAATGRRLDALFRAAAMLVLLLALAALGALIYDVWHDGASRLSLDFIRGFSSRFPERAGIWHAVTGSMFVILVTASLAAPIGVAASGS